MIRTYRQMQLKEGDGRKACYDEETGESDAGTE